MKDHPRSRGVYAAIAKKVDPMAGSSPLARGLHRCGGGASLDAGIIPARAGFTVAIKAIGTVERDHPRSRGVYPYSTPFTYNNGGSSPLARGLPVRDTGGVRKSRIIPARAGFTAALRARSPTSWDHPRSRGVYHDAASSTSRAAGSSPLARGLRLWSQRATARTGIIPARAGFTSPPCVRGRVRGDHPRSRGVYEGDKEWQVIGYGSSPLARGLPWGDPYPNTDHGIIPARAGFTRRSRRTRFRWRDHPRSRGVYAVPFAAANDSLGSSPLARGLHRPGDRPAT